MRDVTKRWVAVVLLLICCVAAYAADARSLPDFTELVEESYASVVNISTTQKLSHRSARGFPHHTPPKFPEGMPFGERFRRFFDDHDKEEGDDFLDDYDGQSLGSGFIVSKDGYILTNNHVISEADEIIVRLSDRRELKAELIGADKRSDVALLKVETEDDLPTVRIGDSNKLKVGEWVLAIGSPFGFDHSVTAGIVSAKGRSLPNENYVPFIQTDVAINPGNSGGPLFNLDGEVVGINAQIYSRTGGFMGLSFTIPINMAMNVVDQLKGKGYVSRGWLGVIIQDVTRELAESFGLDKPMGALIARVLPDSPAEKAGIEVGDIIIEFDGQQVVNSAALPPIVGSSSIGGELKVRVMRQGKMMSLKVQLGELPGDDDVAITHNGESSQRVSIKSLGIVASELTSKRREKLELNDGDQGVFIEHVKNGPARKAGLRKGDVVEMINRVKIKNIKQFKEVVSKLPAGKSVPVRILRPTGPIFLALRIPEDD
ncbi:MAG: DegQ family serine endoprotease [Gammaproteobacteria bacterium]|nr:DegQ family serine endoprotease [Gammaproteobacteria bacterium]